MSWEDIKLKLGEAAQYIKRKKILDKTVKSLLKKIPVVGDIVAEYWGDLALDQEQKSLEVAEFLERLSNQEEAHFETLCNYLEGQKQEIKQELIKGQKSLNGLLDDVTKLMKITKRILETGDATRENTKDLKIMVRLLLNEVGRISKRIGISTVGEALEARVPLSESDKTIIEENKMVHKAIREIDITIIPEYSYQMGLFAVYQRHYLDAEHHFKEVLSVDSKYADAYTGLALIYQMRANDMLSRGNFQLVKQLLRKAEMNIENTLKLDHFDLKALLQSGYIFKEYGQNFIRIGQPEKATAPLDKGKQHFEFVLEKDPQNSGAFNGLGNIYYLKNELDSAIIHYEKAIQIAPDYLFAHHDLAAAYYKKGENDISSKQKFYEKAIEEFKNVLKLNEHQHSLDQLYVNEIQNRINFLNSELKRL